MGVDTRNLGRPSSFDGSDAKWRDFAVVFRSYAALVNPHIETGMTAAEISTEAMTRTALTDENQQQACLDLYHLLLHMVENEALDRVINAGHGEGYEAWRPGGRCWRGTTRGAGPEQRASCCRS